MVRTTLFAIAFLFILVGCKPSQISFSPSGINISYVKAMFAAAEKFDTAKIDSGNIHVASLSETFIYRDGLAEKTIMNDSSTKEKLEIPLIDKQYKLFVITTKIDNIPAAIFLPTILDGSGKCIGIGPALVGKYDYGGLVFYKRIKYHTKRKSQTAKWVLDKKATYFSNDSVFDPYDRSKTKLNIRFITNEIDLIPDLHSFTVKQIYQLSDNRFGGKKPLIFDIHNIFEDSEALRFTHIKTFKSQ